MLYVRREIKQLFILWNSLDDLNGLKVARRRLARLSGAGGDAVAAGVPCR